MRRYKMIDHTGDIAIEVYGRTLAELFRNAAFGYFDIITDTRKIKPKLEERISLAAGDTEALLVSWLSELLYLFDAKRVLFSEFTLKRVTEKSLEASIRGEAFDPKRHLIQTEVKAVTYHGMKIEKKGAVYSTVIVFDI